MHGMLGLVAKKLRLGQLTFEDGEHAEQVGDVGHVQPRQVLRIPAQSCVYMPSNLADLILDLLYLVGRLRTALVQLLSADPLLGGSQRVERSIKHRAYPPPRSAVGAGAARGRRPSRVRLISMGPLHSVCL